MWKSWPSIKSRPLRLEFEIPIDKTQEFWEYVEAGEFRTTRCRFCDSLHFPPVADCPDCRSSDMEWVALEGKGELVAFTHVIARPTSFQGNAPYTIAISSLEEGIKVLAWLVDTDITDVEVGMKVRLRAGKTTDGDPSYWFTPA
ncbi:MAG: Zn-ribbon domain-containing OB-fold protein [Candidatus Bathyarchaeota archaeon]|jgi:uncharacterized OB-fold protein